MLRGLTKTALKASAAAVVAGSGAALYYRPDPSDPKLLANQSDWAKRLKHAGVPLSDNPGDGDPMPLSLARWIVITSVTLLSKVYMDRLNKTDVVQDDRWQHLIDVVKHRPEGQPLLTVGNHNSTLDDPVVFGALLPADICVQPKLVRWSVCSQEFCFGNEYLAAFFGAGKVMPIERGGDKGIDQQFLIDFGRRLAAGDWCNIFPEARTVQTGVFGGRLGPKAAQIGSLKWGVGKLIAHCPVAPVVIPIFHTGMQEVVPEDPVTKDCLRDYPECGKAVTVRVGRELRFDDLIAAHERKHNGGQPLRKLAANARQQQLEQSGKDGEDSNDSSSSGDSGSFGPSTAAEKELYAQITRRIQVAMEVLEKEARLALQEEYPEEPEVVKSGKWKEIVARLTTHDA